MKFDPFGKKFEAFVSKATVFTAIFTLVYMAAHIAAAHLK